MRKLFYARLALSNIRKNARTYIPYILSCTLTVAMTYIMYLLPRDPGLTGARGEVTLRSTRVLGSFVVTIFAVNFLFYFKLPFQAAAQGIRPAQRVGHGEKAHRTDDVL